jgi:hypothetical protein
MASALLVSEQHADCDVMAQPPSAVAAWDDTVTQGPGSLSGSFHSSEWSTQASSSWTSSPFGYQRANIANVDVVLWSAAKSFGYQRANIANIDVVLWSAAKSRSPERHNPKNAQIALEQIRALHRKQEGRRREQAEAEWIAANRARYAGRWVALLGGDLIAAADSAKSVAQAAAGAPSTPLIIYLDYDLPFAGW